VSAHVPLPRGLTPIVRPGSKASRLSTMLTNFTDVDNARSLLFTPYSAELHRRYIRSPQTMPSWSFSSSDQIQPNTRVVSADAVTRSPSALSPLEYKRVHMGATSRSIVSADGCAKSVLLERNESTPYLEAKAAHSESSLRSIVRRSKQHARESAMLSAPFVVNEWAQQQKEVCLRQPSSISC
jgi:hypothetical protein